MHHAVDEACNLFATLATETSVADTSERRLQRSQTEKLLPEAQCSRDKLEAEERKKATLEKELEVVQTQLMSKEVAQRKSSKALEQERHQTRDLKQKNINLERALIQERTSYESLNYCFDAKNADLKRKDQENDDYKKRASKLREENKAHNTHLQQAASREGKLAEGRSEEKQLRAQLYKVTQQKEAQKQQLDRLKQADKENQHSIQEQKQENENVHRTSQETEMKTLETHSQNIEKELAIREARQTGCFPSLAEFAHMSQQRELEHPSLARENARLQGENGEMRSVYEDACFQNEVLWKFVPREMVSTVKQELKMHQRRR